MATAGKEWKRQMAAGWKRAQRRRRAAVPFEVMKQLASEALPPDPQVYSERLTALMAIIELNGESK